ncbi:MAG: sigma 54-interacting transcriptional regulator [Deltaproteobacteria bacterium]|nr:sigma 54-interacting transcriptional regulator [Deltaproteobacteria bacterium]
MTGHASVESAVEAMRLGAFDYLPKPFPTEALLMKLERLFRFKGLERDLAAIRTRTSEEGFLGRSRKVLRLLETVRSVAGTDATVLLQGESGTGKELLAELLHRQSPRSSGPLVKIGRGCRRGCFVGSRVCALHQGGARGDRTR